jgi:hypothetical protein
MRQEKCIYPIRADGCKNISKDKVQGLIEENTNDIETKLQYEMPNLWKSWNKEHNKKTIQNVE